MIMAVTVFVLLSLTFLGITSGLRCSSRHSPSFSGYYMEATDCPGATLRNFTSTNSAIICCVLDTAMVPVGPHNVKISREIYLKMVGDTTRAKAIYPYYMQALSEANMSRKVEIAAFTAQVLYETSGMKFSEHNLTKQESNENVEMNGGRFISRGFLPLIGEHMYQAAGLAVDLGILGEFQEINAQRRNTCNNLRMIDEPERVALPSMGFKVAAWLWRNGYSSLDSRFPPSGNLGKFCNGTEYSFVQLSYNIRRSTKGFETLFKYWRHTTKILGLSCPLEGRGKECSAGNKQGVCKLVTACKGEYSGGRCSEPFPVVCCLDCQNPIDLAFVVDSSGSVQQKNFDIGLQFVTKVCDFFDISYPHGTRVALIRYTDKPTIMFYFNTYVSKRDVINAIKAVSYTPGGTRTDLALRKAYKELFSNSTYGVRPKEMGLPRVLVLLTDGRTVSGTQTVVEPSELLRGGGVNIFVIGIGPTINKEELNIIASDPDADHVICPKSFEEVTMFVDKMQEASCYEPALLEEEKEISSSIEQTAMKYYKYDLQNSTRIKTLFLKNTGGKATISVSLHETNPRKRNFSPVVCEESSQTISVNTGVNFTKTFPPQSWQLEALEMPGFCDSNPDGGFTEPISISDGPLIEEGKIVYVSTCSSRWVYLSLEGVNKTNTFNLTLFSELIRIRNLEVENGTRRTAEKNETYTFPIPKEVYVGAAVATLGTTATVAVVVSLSCVKDFEINSSAKIKKKKKEKSEGKLKVQNNTTKTAAVNNGYEEDGSEGLHHSNTKCSQRLSLKPLLKPIGTSNPCTAKKTTKTTSVTSKREQKLASLSQNGANDAKHSKPKHQMSLVSTMIHELTHNEFADEAPQSPKRSSIEEQRFQREVRSASVSVSVVTSRKVKTSTASAKTNSKSYTKKRNTLLTGIGTNHASLGNQRQKFNPSNDWNPERQSKKLATHLEQQNPHTGSRMKNMHVFENMEPSDDTPKKISCCFPWQLSRSHDNVNESLPPKDEEKQVQMEYRTAEQKGEKKGAKVSRFCRWKGKITKRTVLAFICPCFTYYILEVKDGAPQGTGDNNNEKEPDADSLLEIRDSRFEKDTQMSQTLCILISQLLFLAGAHARDNVVGCAVVAIVMNYLQLVALCWLVVQALYLFSFTRTNENESNRQRRINFYYAGAWGFPLFIAVTLGFKYESYSKHPHCWISFTDALSWSVATPIITLGLVQLILIILLLRALFSYRKQDTVQDKENKKSIIKSGLKTVVCITITVLLTWLVGSLSLNIDRGVYHIFFTIFNALQGCAFFVFYVLLNPQVRLLVVALWQWKNSSVTPFDEFKGIEIEEDKGKDKGKTNKSEKGKNGKSDSRKKEEETTQKEVSVKGIPLTPDTQLVSVLPLRESNKERKNYATTVDRTAKKEPVKESIASKYSVTTAKKQLSTVKEPKKALGEGQRSDVNSHQNDKVQGSSFQAQNAYLRFQSSSGESRPNGAIERGTVHKV